MNNVKIHFENDIFVKSEPAVYLLKKYAKDLCVSDNADTSIVFSQDLSLAGGFSGRLYTLRLYRRGNLNLLTKKSDIDNYVKV